MMTIEQLREQRIDAEERFASDPHRPRYHFLPPQNWLNDPNGPIWFDGCYHLFYQHNPAEAKWGDIHWGHAVSADLLHWEDWPIALEPRTDGVDEMGCFTGSAFVQADGTPTLAYTGITSAPDMPRGRRENQSLAVSHDGMRTWEKLPQNPVIAASPEGLRVTGFRDPTVWRDGADGPWYMAIGSGIEGQGGAVLLYRSSDLLDWEYLHPLMVGDAESHGAMWECPDFFPIGERHVLLVSTLGRQMYFSGGWSDEHYVAGAEGWADYSPRFYAAKSFLCPRGRRILWGWLREARAHQAQLDAGWSGLISLPRVLTMLPDGTLGCDPAEELQRLRAEAFAPASLELRPGEERATEIEGDCVEIAAEVTPSRGGRFTLSVRCSPDGEERTEVLFDAHEELLGIDTTRSSLSPAAETRESVGPLRLAHGEPLRLRVFVDRSVVEVFANGRAAVTERIYPSRPDSVGVRVAAEGSGTTVQRLEAWRMRDIWRHTETR